METDPIQVDETQLRCPKCGATSHINDWEICGADEPNLWCPNCGDQVEPLTPIHG